jgi:cellulose synthase/poly-beta-1,6-N-acetylglucosamine synthase-like glycosyltransferase
LTVLMEALLGCAALLLLVPVTVVLVEVLLALTRRVREVPEERVRPRLAVLIPAHNEASIIVGTIRSVLPQLSTSDRLLVVADNCLDETADIACAAGAQVIERSDTTRRGKGYALDFGVRHLGTDAPEVVVIVDADCQVAAGALDRLARRCVRSGRPVQALYLMYAPNGAGFKTRIAQFAWIVKNQIRPLGLHRLGLPCQLMGTGMAFPWSCLAARSLATGHLVEDLKLGIDLARAGMPPLFCPEALVTSAFPISGEGVRAQRTRWEHGHLGIILSEAPRLLLDSLVRLSPPLLALALDVSVPPLALLTLLVLGVWFASILLYHFTSVVFPLLISSGALGMLALAVLLSWASYGRRIVSLGDLAFLVFYALAKVPLYAKFIVARQLDWVRSKRDGDES